MKNRAAAVSTIIFMCLIMSFILVNAELVDVSNQQNTIFEPDKKCAVQLNIKNAYNKTINASLSLTSRLDVSAKKSFSLLPLEERVINITFNSPSTAGIYRINWTLTLFSDSGIEKKNGSFKITISRILREIKLMEKEYSNEIKTLRNASRPFNNDEINRFLDHIEYSVGELSTLYKLGKYDEINTKMRAIEAEFVIVREKIEEIKTKQQQEFDVTLNTIIWFILPSVFFTVFSFLMLRFYFGNKMSTPEIEDLKIINERISIHFGDVVPLKKRIKRVEEIVSKSQNERLKTELDVIKEKYRQGLLGLCEDYLLALEKELEYEKK